MKKKLVVTIILFLFVVLIVFYIVNTRSVSYITLDINPSIKINLNKNNKVKNIVALNEDAKDIVDSKFTGKSLENALKIITSNAIKKGYIKDEAVILIYSKGNVNNNEVEKIVRKNLEDKNVFTDIITIDKITKEDEKLAKKYNITASKAAYINFVKKDNSKLEVDNLINKSIKEIKETNERGFYCDKDYFLEGDHCFKEIGKENAIKGEVCPQGYYEYNGVCYKEEPIQDGKGFVCPDDRNLEKDECIKILEEDPIPINQICTSGELVKKSDVGLAMNGSGDDAYICLDKSNAQAPTLRCLTINHTMIEGQCYVGPAPLINGGCPGVDVVVGGGCYSKDDGDQWVCPDGRIYEKSKDSVPKYCPDTLSYTAPKVDKYKCEKGFTLENNKCIMKTKEPAQKEKICPSGYDLVNNGRCINYNKTSNKENGYICNKENSRLEGNICAIYEIVEAKQ